MRRSNSTDAYPTLSDDTNRLLLFMLVACTAYQLIAPSPAPVWLSNLSCTIVLSTSCSYLRNEPSALVSRDFRSGPTRFRIVFRIRSMRSEGLFPLIARPSCALPSIRRPRDPVIPCATRSSRDNTHFVGDNKTTEKTRKRSLIESGKRENLLTTVNRHIQKKTY